MEPLGDTDFDLAKYANNEKAHEDKLILRGGPDPESFIEIYIKAKVLEKAPQTSTNMSMMSMPIIEERESESDFYDELQKQDKVY